MARSLSAFLSLARASALGVAAVAACVFPVAMAACSGESADVPGGPAENPTPADDASTSDAGAVDGPTVDPDAQPSSDAAVPNDASGADGATALGGPSKCGASSGFRLCDGFEGATIDNTLWPNTFTNNATVALDAMHVARGSKALHVHTGVNGADNAGTNGGLRTTHGFPFPNGDLWGRAFVYMAKASPDAHTNLIEAVGDLAGGGQSHYRLGVTTNHLLSGNYIPGDYADRSTMTMPLDGWTCFEWHFDGKNDEYHFFVNGNERTEMAILGNHTPQWTAPSFAYLEIGLHLYHDLPNEPVLDAWYDEIALDGTRVGCAN
jgi:hypothetical protein